MYNSLNIRKNPKIEDEICNYKSNDTFYFQKVRNFKNNLHELIFNPKRYKEGIKSKININESINNIILNGRTFLEKNQLMEGYNYLSQCINNQIKNPDIFYLFGEICRKIKYMELAEKYLIRCLDFKTHNTNVYISLGLLYQEIKQFKYSNVFFKQYLNNIKNEFVHYNLGINYLLLKKYLKCIYHLTEAIKMNNKCPVYYELRSKAYKEVGQDLLSKKDLSNYNYYKNNIE